MKIRDVMTTDVVTARLETPYKQLVELMMEHGITGLPVVDDDGRVLGIVTEADLVDKTAYGDPPGGILGMIKQAVFGPPADIARRAWAMTAGGLMTADVYTASPDDEVAPVARRLVERDIKRMPVVDVGDRLLGIVSRRDLLAAFARPDGQIAADVQRLLGNMLAVPEDLHVEGVDVDDGVVRLSGTVHHPSDIGVVVAAIRGIPGVVAVETELSAREPEPELTGPLTPPLV